MIAAAAWLLAALAPGAAAAEVTLGLTGGLALTGEQDVKLREHGDDGRLLAITERRGEDASPGALAGLTLTLWGAPWPWLGVQLDALHWTTSATLAGPGESGGSLVIDQDRTALFLSVLGRVTLDETRGAFAYGGVGGGLVRSRVSPGDEEFGAGVGAVAGVAVRVTPRVRVRVELRYLITPDVDAGARPGLGAETSGSADGNLGHLVFGPHLDTQFIPLLVGLDWVF